MYQLTYDSKILFDPYMQSTAITDAKYTGKSNSVSYLDFSIAPNHPLYNTIEKDKGLVELYSDNVLKFRGKINEIEIDDYGYKIVACNSVLQYLNNTRVRSYSTVPGDADLTAPTSVEGYFQWLIDQHNLHVKNPSERFEVGVNQGAVLDKNDYILRSNDGYPTTLDEINNKILEELGGYLFVEYKDDRNILNLYADVHSTNSQIIDFGSNILSISYKENDDDLYTVVIPRGGTPEKKDGDTEDPKPINIKGLPDNTFDTDSDIVKSDDCVYSLSATKRYGYREYYYSNNDILDPSNLLKAAVLQLRLQMAPKVTIETKAIDLSIAYPGYEQLNIGDACRVRSARHNLDDYFMLSEMELDLNDPSQTTYTFGDEYVSLVGRQSNYLKKINSSIDRNYEDVNTAMSYGKAATKLADAANKTADAANNTAVKANDKAQKATEDAFNANTTANKAQNTATTAKNTADKAQNTANVAKTTADKAQTAAIDAKAVADSANKAAEELKKKTVEIDKQVESASNAAAAASAKADQVRTDLQKQVDANKASADAASAKADQVRNDFNNLTIGGRNLLLNSNFSKGTNNWVLELQTNGLGTVKAEVLSGFDFATTMLTINVTKNTSGLCRIYQLRSPNPMRTDTVDTVSFWATATESVPVQFGRNDDGKFITVQKGWHYYKATVPKWNGSNAFVIGFKNGFIGTLKITNIMWEHASKASQWSPAPEDFQAQVNSVKAAADAAQKAADKANASTADLDKSIKAVDAKAIAAKQAAAEAQSKAENVASDLDSANAVIEQHTTELGELTTKVSNAVKKSDSALSVSTEAKQTATEASTTATSAYRDSQTALTQSTTATQTATAAKTTAESASKTASDSLKQSSAAVQTANQISTTLRTEYQTKADADKLYATQSSLKQTSDSITASVSKTYATKDALSALQNVADNAIESWRGTGVPTLENKPASDWTTIDDKKKHSGDLYYDKSTGKAYRFGSDDGVTYTWELNQDTDVTKALKDAANAQTSANNAQASATAANTAASKAQSTANTAVSNAATAKNAADAAQSSANKAQGDVDKLKIDIPETYATKSSLSQTAESITANVESVKTTANSAVTAASKAQQTADGISVNLTKNYQTKSQSDTLYATKASLKATSDSISAEVTKAQGTADGAVTAASKAQQTADAVTLNLSKNYQTKAQNDALYATQTSLKATSDSLSANITANAKTAQSAVDKATSLEANLNGFKTTVSETYGRGSNLWVNPTFDADKPQITSRVSNVTAPNGSGVNLLANRDHHNSNTSFPVVPGHKYVITAHAKLIKGNLPLHAGIWYTALTAGHGWDTYVGAESTSDLSDGWIAAIWRFSCPNGKSRGCVFFQIDQSASNGSTQWYISNVTCADVTGLQPAGDYATNSSVTQTADSIKAQVTEVSKTANSAMSKATTVEQTANGLSSKITEQGKTLDATVTTANEAKSTADSNKTAISQVSTTASSALTKASSVEQNLNGFKTTVAETYQTKSGMSDYATNSSLTQTADSIKAEVTEVSKTANSAMSKATTVEQTANGLSSKITEQGKTLDATVTTANEAKSTADSNKTAISQVSTTASSALTKASSVEQNLNGFKTTVSQTYTTKDDFNNLTIGGRNLLLNSNFSKGTNNWVLELQTNGLGTVKAEVLSGFDFATTMLTINVTKNTSGLCRIYQLRSPNPMRTDTVDTVSFWATATESVPVQFGRNDDGKFITVQKGWHYYKATVPKWNGSNAFVIGFKNGFIGTLKITNIMWEHASKASQWSPAPEDLQPAGDYSTKSYVDQTAKSVALGVVQNYKGADGSGLATKSDITVATNSITTTVSKTYQTKDDMKNYATQSQLTQTNDKVTIAFQNSQSVGGQNLLLKTSVPTVVTGSEGANQTVAFYDLAAGNLSNLPTGMYHIQFKIKSDTAGGTVHPLWRGEPYMVGEAVININIGTEEQTYSKNIYISNNNYPDTKQLGVRLDNAKGKVTIREMKLERGDSMTPWTIAPEDTMNDLTNAVQNQAADIAGKVSNDDYTGYVNATNKNLNDIQSSQQHLSDSISNEIALRESYIQFGQDASNPYMDMGNSSSPNKMRLTNTKLSFTSNNIEVASVSNDKMRISNAEVLQSFRIGNFVWQPRSDGHMALKYSPEV